VSPGTLASPAPPPPGRGCSAGLAPTAKGDGRSLYATTVRLDLALEIRLALPLVELVVL
jgi:hypothetical protein